jgi:glycosyltransferase involved in cell wall biosynthesis
MKLSIITINYNDLEGLKNTVDSVINQDWKDYEHIIIDGGSTDGSCEYIKNNAQCFSYSVSEPDKGIYNAMNKGIIKANGEYLLMLNAGDVLHNDKVLSNVFEKANYTQDIIYGDVDRESKGVVFTESIFPDALTFGFLKDGMISHQAVFFKRRLHEIVGLYDETLKYGADWNFIILSVCRYNASYIHLNLKMAICSADGLTCSPSQFSDMQEERKRVLEKEFPAFIDDYLFFDELDRKKISNRANYFVSNVKNFIKDKVKNNKQ